MQDTLTFTVNEKKYISKPFDFETMCLINDNLDGQKGVLSICRDAVDYMFEGTEATQDIINKLAPGMRAALCNEAWRMYVEATQVKNV